MEIKNELAVKPTPQYSDQYLSSSNLNLLSKFGNALNQIEDVEMKLLLNVASITFLKNEKGPNVKPNEVEYSKLLDLLNINSKELKEFIVSNNHQLSLLLLEEILQLDKLNTDDVDSNFMYIYNSKEFVNKNFPSINTRDACSDCTASCLNSYRYSPAWYSYYYDVYNACISYGFTNCGQQAYVYAEHMININFCEPACDDVCNIPCTDCPPGYTYDGANCFLGKIPQGWDGYIDHGSRKFYLEKKCCQICPSGFQYDSQNCRFNFSFNPSNYDPFIYTASDGSKHFYVEPDNNGNCPTGTYKDAAGNCYVGAVPSGYSPFIYDNKFYVEPHCYPNGNNCCPTGMSYDGDNCVMGTYPSGWQPFVYDGGFYVIPNCD